jgi:hypothetical protein
MRRFQLSIVVLLLAVPLSNVRAQGTCFKGPIRPGCSGFVLFEASAAAARGGTDRRAPFDVPLSDGTTITSFVHYRDLPGYYSGSLGYVRVVDPRTAIGAVGELGFSNTSDVGNARRFALTGRWRRQVGDWSVDAGAGPLVAQVFAASNACCVERKLAYGGTLETAVLFRGYVGATAGADLINGAGRTSAGVHAGVRVGSYGAVITSAIAAAATGILWWGLARESD